MSGQQAKYAAAWKGAPLAKQSDEEQFLASRNIFKHHWYALPLDILIVGGFWAWVIYWTTYWILTLI